MNKYIKLFLIIIGTIILVIIFSIGIIFLPMRISRSNKEIEIKKYSKKCDSVLYINEKPELKFTTFKKSEIKSLTFQILRNGKVINDTVLNNKSEKINIPYKYFLKTDTIILITTNKLHYYISGYHHEASCNWGMTGPVGSTFCVLSIDCTINNSNCNGTIVKINGWVNPKKSKKNRLVYASSREFDSLGKVYKITYKKANLIFNKNRKNKVWMSQFTVGIQITPYASYYILGEELESRKNQKDIIKINTETGEFKRYSNYPFDN